MYYACISYAAADGMRHAGTTWADSFSQLKRKASRIANNHYSTLDKMEVSHRDPDTRKEIVTTFYRINRKTPNNEIKRGQWK